MRVKLLKLFMDAKIGKLVLYNKYVFRLFRLKMISNSPFIYL